MRGRTLALVSALLLAVAACSGTDEASEDERPDDIATNRIVEPGDVAALPEGTRVITQGVLVMNDDTRVCEALTNDALPQCDGASVVLADLDPESVVALETIGGVQGGSVTLANYPFSVAGTVEAGTLVDTEIANRVYTTESDGLRVRLMPAQTPFSPQELRSGEQVWWAMDITNTSTETIRLTFNSGQVGEVTIDDGVDEIYRWSEGLLFTQSITEFPLQAGTTQGTSLRGQLSGDPGADLTLRGWITATGADDVVVEAPVEMIQP